MDDQYRRCVGNFPMPFFARSSASRQTILGSAALISSEKLTGSQYLRNVSPAGVPGPTRVIMSFSRWSIHCLFKIILPPGHDHSTWAARVLAPPNSKVIFHCRRFPGEVFVDSIGKYCCYFSFVTSADFNIFPVGPLGSSGKMYTRRGYL